MSRAQVLSIGVDKVSMVEAVQRCLGFITGQSPRYVVTPNAEISYAAARDPALAAVINQADLVVPDGVGVVLAARLLGDPIAEKVAGADLATHLLQALSQQGKGNLFLLGARADVVERAATRIAIRFPGIRVVGFHHGYFTPEEEPAVIEQIRQAAVDLLVVGLGSPLQEFWMHRHRDVLNVRMSIGVGGTIDLWAGAARRAPDWMIRANLEWLYRIVRFGRYGRSLPPLFKFLWLVVLRRMRG